MSNNKSQPQGIISELSVIESLLWFHKTICFDFEYIVRRKLYGYFSCSSVRILTTLWTRLEILIFFTKFRNPRNHRFQHISKQNKYFSTLSQKSWTFKKNSRKMMMKSNQNVCNYMLLPKFDVSVNMSDLLTIKTLDKKKTYKITPSSNVKL